MSDLEFLVGGEAVDPAEGWSVHWPDSDGRIARITDPDGSASLALVEDAAGNWVVTIGGRRIPVTVRSWRERVIAEASAAARHHIGPVEITATLPGLVVGITVAPGDQVSAGDPLLSLEAMKMENEVRAPRDGQVTEVAVTAGQKVATGDLLVRLG